MKTNSIKRVAIVLCAASMAVSSVSISTVHAAGFVAQEERTVQLESWRMRPFQELTQEQQGIVRRELREAGLSDSEINQLILQEKELIRKSSQGSTFFRRPRIGQIRRRSFTIYNNEILVGASALAKAMGAHGIPLAMASGMAALILERVANETNIRGVTFTVQETYGYSNDGFLEWNVGPVTWKFKR